MSHFSKHLFRLLKHIASIEHAHASTQNNEDGVFELEVLAVYENDVGTVATLKETATEVEIVQFELRLEALEKSLLAQKAEDEARGDRIKEILSKLTKEERLLIERPLLEDLPPDDEGTEDHF